MNNFSEAEEEFSMLSQKPIDIRSILMKYLSYWKWFLISLIVCITIGLIYYSYKLPKYKVQTSILFKDDQRGGGSSEMNLFKEIGLVTQKNNVDNEIEILTKSLIVEKVVRNMGIYASYTEMRPAAFVRKVGLHKLFPKLALKKTVVLYGDECPFLIELPVNLQDKLKGKILFDVIAKTNGSYLFSGVFSEKHFNINASSSDSIVNLPFGKVNLVKGKRILNEDMIVRVELQNPQSVAEQYLGNLDVKLTSKTTSVADLSLICINGELGKVFIEGFIDTYNEEGIRGQIELADKMSQLIDDHLSQLNDELSLVETQVQNYKQSQGLTDIASQADIFNTQSANVGQRKVEVESQYAIASNLNNYVQQKNSHDEMLPANSGINNTVLNEQINLYNNLVMERNKLSRIASSSNQSMIALNNQIESAFNSVKTGLQNEKNNLEIQLNDISAMYYQNNARIRAIPRQERVYSDIKRQQNVKEELFLYLLQKKEEKYMNMATAEPSSKLIDQIRILGVVSPSLKLIGLLFLAIGLIIPISIIKIKDLLRYNISTKDEIENISSVPVLGEIPLIQQMEFTVIKENDNGSFSEMVRLLRANLLFISDNNNKKVINMLSSISGEGKTYITINLATSLAMLDKKVLIVELDIRKPKLSKYMQLEKEQGITLYLSGYLTKEEIIKPTPFHPNLSVIPAGKIPPNPNELLAKPMLDELMNELRNEYDYILIDTAPIGVVSDSFLLNRLVDINLYIVRADYTPKRYILDADRYFKENRLKKMYFILNGVDLNSVSHRYGYGKKYEYGYRSSS